MNVEFGVDFEYGYLRVKLRNSAFDPTKDKPELMGAINSCIKKSMGNAGLGIPLDLVAQLKDQSIILRTRIDSLPIIRASLILGPVEIIDSSPFLVSLADKI